MRRESPRSWCLPVLCVCLAGCERFSTGHDPIPPSRTYSQYCAGCHGARGDGRGPAARFLLEPPRDFTRAVFKFKSTPGGELPTDDDLLRVIDRGLRGTAMPAFEQLSSGQKSALLDTIKGFSPAWKEQERFPALEIPPDPFVAGASRLEVAVRRGEEIYHGRAQCASCHPDYLPPDRREAFEQAHDVLFRENLTESVVKSREDGRRLRPPDFLVDPLKSVESPGDLYRVLALGVGGTEMPTWSGVLEEEEIWALVHYVDARRREGERERSHRRDSARRRFRWTR